jgi:hypothetical protein
MVTDSHRLTGFCTLHCHPGVSIVAAFFKESFFLRSNLAMRTERRKATRHPFVARAEIIDEKENARTSSKISDLSLSGCYVEMMNPFPEGTAVVIEIYTEDEMLEAHGTVARIEPKQGMGLAFDELPPYFANVLNKWIKETKSMKAN